MTSGFAWGAPPTPGAWTPSPYYTPFASPHGSPFFPGMPALFGSPYGTPFGSPYGSPFAPALFSPLASPSQAPSLPPDAIPPVGAPAVQIAPWLAAPLPGTPASASLATWDVRDPPKDARYTTERGARAPLSAQAGEQATYPANGADLALVFDGAPALSKLFPGGATVLLPAASVGDVLTALWDFLQQRLSKAEVDAVRAGADGEAAWEALVHAMAARCRASAQLAEVEWNQGLRRVDLLGDARAFAGARAEYLPDGAWRLRVALAPVPKSP